MFSVVFTVFMLCLIFSYARSSVWNDNKDCHLCGITPEDDDGMVDTMLVVNGAELKNDSEFPWIVAIYRKGKFLCSGALISNQYILTAAHCLTKGTFSDTEKMKADLLRVELSFKGKSSDKVKASEVIIHKKYKQLKTGEFEYDIGLIKLAKKYECSKTAYPICLPKEDMKRMGKSLVIAGFGHHKNKDRNEKLKSATLRKGSINQVEDKVCQKSGPNTGPTESIICGSSEKSKQIICDGDSGSPLFWKFNSVYYTLGVTSSLSDKGACVVEAKSTFSKVYYYKKWLEEKVGKFPKPYKQ